MFTNGVCVCKIVGDGLGPLGHARGALLVLCAVAMLGIRRPWGAIRQCYGLSENGARRISDRVCALVRGAVLVRQSGGAETEMECLHRDGSESLMQ